MADIISGIQSELVTLFKDKKTDTPTNAPDLIEAYGGQFENPKQLVDIMPALYVNSSNQFSLQADDITGQFHTGNYKVDLILFSKNHLNKERTYGDMAKHIDWVLEALRGRSITVDGIPIPVAEDIQGEFFPAMDAAVLTLNIGALEG